MLFVCRIHNNSLGSCMPVQSWDEGKQLLRSWAEDQFERPLTDEESNMLEHEQEVYNDEDADNIYTFSFGEVK